MTHKTRYLLDVNNRHRNGQTLSAYAYCKLKFRKYAVKRSRATNTDTDTSIVRTVNDHFELSIGDIWHQTHVSTSIVLRQASNDKLVRHGIWPMFYLQQCKSRFRSVFCVENGFLYECASTGRIYTCTGHTDIDYYSTLILKGV